MKKHFAPKTLLIASGVVSVVILLTTFAISEWRFRQFEQSIPVIDISNETSSVTPVAQLPVVEELEGDGFESNYDVITAERVSGLGEGFAEYEGMTVAEALADIEFKVGEHLRTRNDFLSETTRWKEELKMKLQGIDAKKTELARLQSEGKRYESPDDWEARIKKDDPIMAHKIELYNQGRIDEAYAYNPVD